MSYNLLIDTQFKDTYNWKYVNCEYKDGKLISTNKVFGIMQELILPDPTKLYARITYKSLSPHIKDIKIGIQNNHTLNISNRIPKYNKEQKLSVISIAEQEKIQIHVIFESNVDINEVEIKEPILIDLNYLHKSTWLKIILDRTVHYIDGYSYTNEYKSSEILPTAEDFSECNLEPAKIGSIIKIDEKKEIEIKAKFIIGKYYLIKLDLEEINQLGNMYFQYGILKSTKIKDQLYMVFKANDKDTLKLILEPNDIMPYKINLKHILLINISNLKLLKSDIPYLPFIGD